MIATEQVKKEIEATKDYQTGHHVFKDTDSGELITLDQLHKEYLENRNESQTEYNYSFTHYIYNCLFRNGGTLIEVKPCNIFPF